MADLTTAPLPITTLTEEEEMFRSAVRDFAESEIRPHVHEMDAAAQFNLDIIPKFFELGLMGVEIPEQFGGAGGNIFLAVLAIVALGAKKLLERQLAAQAAAAAKQGEPA